MVNNIPTSSNDIKKEISKNECLTATVQSRAFSVEEMAEKFNIDLSVWEKYTITTNVWPMGAKDVQKNLTFTDGVVTGTVKSGGIVITHLWQTKITWIRKKPVALAPILYPVDVSSYKFSKNAKTQLGSSPQILVIPDLQAGYWRRNGKDIPMHDKRAMNVVRLLVQRYTFTHVILLGDMLDFAEWTDHFPTPNEQRDTTQRTLVEISMFIAEIRHLQPEAKIIYFEGNHEKRMRSLLIKLVPAAYGLKAVGDIDGFPAMSIPGLLDLKKLDVQWIGDWPSGEYWVDDTLRFIHGHVARKSGLTAGHYVNNYEYSTVYGHTHRREHASRTTWKAGKPTVIFAVSPGCLCKIEDSQIVPAVKDRNNWQQGVLVLTKQDDKWFPEQVEIENGIGYFRGERIKG